MSNMELTTVHVLKNMSVMICCPFCGIKKKVATDKFKDIKHRLTVRCKCGGRFGIQLNFRKNYRKSVEINGEFKMLSPTISHEKRMAVCDLSRNGLRIKMIDTAVVNKGDEILVSFNLDDIRETLICKKVVVRSASGDILGCEFAEMDQYEKELGFYLMT